MNTTSTKDQGVLAGRTWVLIVLTLVYTFNHVDRQILITVIEPIKAEFGLSDEQIGLLTGLAFAALYATLGIPVAMWADRGNRRNIITLALTIWSGMTALTGLANNFWHLFLARMGVGIGESGGTPPATSMIADLYPPQQRAFALGVYTTGIGFGIMVGYILGAFVYAQFGWRAAFFAAGIPGLLLALLVRFTVTEPVRGSSDAYQSTEDAPGFLETLKFMLSQQSYMLILAGCLMICISANAFVAFTSSYLQRTFDVTVSQVSLPLGLLLTEQLRKHHRQAERRPGHDKAAHLYHVEILVVECETHETDNGLCNFVSRLVLARGPDAVDHEGEARERRRLVE